MFKSFYSWFHREISKKPEERDEPSGGRWSNEVRQKVANLSQECRGKLLEVGCGEGLFITILMFIESQLRIYAIDNNINKLLHAKMKWEGKQLNNVKLMCASAFNLPFKDEFFDKIVCINTFYNMESIDAVAQALVQVTRVCKKKGRIIFDFRNSLNPFLKLKYKLAPYYDSTIKEDKLSLNTYKLKQIEGILEKLKLTIVNKIFIGFPKNVLAPIIIIEAKKC